MKFEGLASPAKIGKLPACPCAC